MKVTLVLMASVFVGILALAALKPVGMEQLLSETTAAQRLFSSLLGGAILLVSVVVSINSVILSQEMTDLESQASQIKASLNYHRKVENFINADVTPARPGDFLISVLHGISTHVQRLRSIAADGENEAFEADVQRLTEQISDEVEEARWTLERADWGTFEVLMAGLNYNYSGQLHAISGLKRKHRGDLSEEERDAVDDVVDILIHIGTGREYFKSLYFKRELAHLSSRLLYVALPVIVFTSYVILALDARLFLDISVFGFSGLLISVTFAYTIALAPYLVLTAYIIRAATVSSRTIAAGPFVLQAGGDIESLDLDVTSPTRNWELIDTHDRLSDELGGGGVDERDD